MSNWICIDFGTCNSAAAIEIDGAPKLVSPNNLPFFPTVACVLSKDNIVVGQSAEMFRTKCPEHFLQEFKLDIDKELDCNGADYRRVVAAFLKYIKSSAEIENNNTPLDKALITIPAMYTNADKRKEVMRLAALDAGFSEVEFMREPQAAAYHYVYINGSAAAGLSLIYDLGGGTFDPTLIDMTKVNNPVLWGGDVGVKCGGQFFDAAIYKEAQRCAKNMGKPLIRDERLKDYVACRKLKEDLSAQLSSTTLLSNNEYFTLSREELRVLITDRLRLTFDACNTLISTSDKSWDDIERILLVGGSTSMPIVSDMLGKHLASYNANDVRIVRSMKGMNGEYNHKYAVCLGGIAYITKMVFKRSEREEEKVGVVICGNRVCQLKEGTNTFGRANGCDFIFDDPAMSREHFVIDVSCDINGHYEYLLTTMSTSKATTVGILSLDLRYPFTPKNTMLEDGMVIVAGRTKFSMKRIMK